MYTYSKTSHCTPQIYTFLLAKRKKIKKNFLHIALLIFLKSRGQKQILMQKKADIFLRSSISQQ